MHILAAVEAMPHNHKCFLEFLQDLNDKHECGSSSSAWNPQVREVKIYDIAVPEEVGDDWVADLKSLLNHNRGGFDKAMKFARKFTDVEDVPDVEPTDSSEFDLTKYKDGGAGWWVHGKLLGILPDKHDEEGNELL